MFGIEYLISLVRVLFLLAYAIVTAIPFHFAWNAVAPTYFSFLPPAWHHIGYWSFVSLVLVTMAVGQATERVTPKLVTITNKTEAKS